MDVLSILMALGLNGAVVAALTQLLKLISENTSRTQLEKLVVQAVAAGVTIVLQAAQGLHVPYLGALLPMILNQLSPLAVTALTAGAAFVVHDVVAIIQGLLGKVSP